MITYLAGDATKPIGEGQKVICHICNNIGCWGAGFVMALSRKWSQPESAYREWHRTGSSDFRQFRLGSTQLAKVEKDISVANMIAQNGIGFLDGPPIDYSALNQCLAYVARLPISIGSFSVHSPRFGTGLAGGKWDRIESIIESTLCAADIPVFIYDFK